MIFPYLDVLLKSDGLDRKKEWKLEAEETDVEIIMTNSKADFAEETKHFKDLKILSEGRGVVLGGRAKKSLSWGWATKAPATWGIHFAPLALVAHV